MSSFIIIPGCSDLNRGDQALVWETKRLAEEAGFNGDFYLTTEKNEPVNQSIAEGLNIISPILEHPSRKFKNKENINYNFTLKCKWGVVAICDLVVSLLILSNTSRKLIFPFLGKRKKESLLKFFYADGLFMKGGGLLQTYGGISSTYSMYFWVYPILLAHKLKKPVYIMPNSFGPFKGPFVKRIVKKALANCTVVTARESISKSMVKNDLNLDIDLYPDLAFNLPKSDLIKEDVFKEYNLPLNGKKIVALTMRPYRFPESNDPINAYENYKQETAKFINWLYEKGFMPVLIDHTLAVNAHENDNACIKEVTKLLDSEKYRIISNKSYNCKDLKAIYGFCDYIIGTRFHSVIFSFGCDVPGIAIAYVGNKSQGIMHDIGLDDYVIKIDDVSFENLRDKFKKLISNEIIVKKKIENYNENCKKMRENLKKLLEEKHL